MPDVLARHLASRSRPLNVKELMREMDLEGQVNKSTVIRWLNSAQAQNLVEMQGQSKASVWTATAGPKLDSLREHLALPVEMRPRVTYQEDFLEEYVPNETSYLTPKQVTRLHDQCKPGTAAFATLNDHDKSLFMCGLSFASSSLEGNVYDMASTEKLIELGEKKDGASAEHTTMVLNHHEAARYLVENIHYPNLKNDVAVTARDVKSIHGLVSAYLLRDPMMCGAIRRTSVRIKESSYIPLSGQDAIERAFQVMMAKAQQIRDPYEQAMFLLVHLPYLQPFEDCNKRTARIACNIPLLRGGCVPMSWLDVEHKPYIEGTLGVYERNNVTLLAEVFVQGYVTASERFNVMLRSCVPNEMVIRYRQDIRTTVRSVVLQGDAVMPADMNPADESEYQMLVEQELELLRKGNASALIRFRLQENDIKAWLAQECGEGYNAPAGERDRPRMRA